MPIPGQKVKAPATQSGAGGAHGLPAPRRVLLAPPGNRLPGLAAKLDASSHGTDDIEIGADLPVPGEEILCSTAADAAKTITGVKYLIKGWVPFAMVTGIVAEPGLGKSALALWLARTVMTGGTWFNHTKGPQPGKVLWCGTENDIAITLQRMRDWSIPMANLLFPFEDPLATINLTYAGHLEQIEALVIKHKIKAVFVDSLRGGHDEDENSSRVGRILQSLSTIAERTKAALFVIHHTRKLLPGEEITANSCRGSNAILAMMRSVIGIDRPDFKVKTCRARLLKENLGLAPKPIGFTVSQSGLTFDAAPELPRRDTRKLAAEDWLRANLAAGQWCLQSEVLENAQQAGFSVNAIQRARETLGITQDCGNVRPRPADGKSEWRLPAPTEGSL